MKSRPSVRWIAEAIAVVGVVASLFFIREELEQNQVAARAAAYQDLGIAVTELWVAAATDRDLSDAWGSFLAADSASWADFDPSDRGLVTFYFVGILRLYETTFLNVDEGLLDPSALQSLGWGTFTSDHPVWRLWPEVRDFVTPDFREYLATTYDLSPG
ncbi:MAG: hypothetical protein ACR2QM_18550 [Longimicrobiales bacterium]